MGVVLNYDTLDTPIEDIVEKVKKMATLVKVNI
jgi:phosphoribosylglycinamide formyltransferase 2